MDIIEFLIVLAFGYVLGGLKEKSRWIEKYIDSRRAKREVELAGEDK